MWPEVGFLAILLLIIFLKLPRHDDMAGCRVDQLNTHLSFMKEYQIENSRFTVLPTPGHSIEVEFHWFFPDGHLVMAQEMPFSAIGRLDLPTGSMEQLLHNCPNPALYSPQTLMSIRTWSSPTIAHEKPLIHFSKT